MMRILKYGLLFGLGLIAVYHFFPEATRHTGSVLADKGLRAGRELAK